MMMPHYNGYCCAPSVLLLLTSIQPTSSSGITTAKPTASSYCSACCSPVRCPVDMVVNQVYWSLLHQKHGD